MARGWGKSEEDLGAEKEQAREERRREGIWRSPQEAERLAKRRSLELSLARIDEQLSKTSHPDRRKALEIARAELTERMRGLNR